MSKIGIIDDVEEEITTIQRTIYDYIQRNNIDAVDVEFKIYSLTSETDEIEESLIKEVIQDIEDFEISMLIIDHKIMSRNESINGSGIFEKIRKIAEDFPTIIMTNRVEESLTNDYVDSDKVYAKSEFFKMEEYSKEKVENILRNIKRYEKLRESTQSSLESLKNELVKDTENQDIINEIIEKERELDKYLPLQQSYLQEVMNPEQLKEILKLIEDANKLLE